MGTLSVSGDTTRKGRMFRAHALAVICGDGYWNATTTGDKRPVWVSYAGEPTELEAVTANLKLGHPFFLGASTSTAYVLPRSAPYQYTRQVLSHDVAVVTAFHPEVFVRDPGIVGDSVRAMVAMPGWWASERPPAPRVAAFIPGVAKARKWDPEFTRLLALATPLAMEKLDRRVTAPILNHPLFHFLVMVRAVEAELVDIPHAGRRGPYDPTVRRIEWEEDGSGLAFVLGLTGTTEAWGSLLASCVSTWMEKPSWHV